MQPSSSASDARDVIRAPVVRAVLLLGLVAAGCGAGETSGARPTATVDTLLGGIVRTISAAPSDSGRWSLELLHEIRPDDGTPGELLEPSDVALTDHGHVVVADAGAGHITVYDASGTFVRTIGAKGEGPGEFRVAWLAVRGDTLFVQDPQLARGSTFRISTGEFLTSRNTACCYWAPIGIDGSGRAVMPMMRSDPDTSAGPAAWYVRAPLSSTSADTVRVPQRRAPSSVWEVKNGDRMQMTVTVPLAPRELRTVDPLGGFVTAWNGDYVLRVSRQGDDTVALFGRVHTAERVSSAEKQAIVDARIEGMSGSTGPGSVPEPVLRESFVTSKIPDVRPPFESFHVDPLGRTWVRRSLADTTLVELDLFSADRRWLDVVRVPGALWPAAMWTSMAWSADRVVVPGEDDDGRPLLRVFRIVRRG